MEFGFINLMGFVIVAVMLIPNIFFAVRFKNTENRCRNKAINITEQIGRYACFILMFMPLGVWEFGFGSVLAFLVYLFGNGILLFAYLLIWIFYFRRQSVSKALALAVIPTCIFLLSGITMQHHLLIVASIIFGIGHIYVTSKNKL